jgi:superfamily II DNA or RNA helicase
MIEFNIFASRVFFSGPKKELKQMFKVLRLKDKNSYWKLQWLLRKFAYLSYSKKGRKRLEEIKRASYWTKFYDLRSHSFPSGFWPRVKSHLDRQGITFTIQDSRRQKKVYQPIAKLPLRAIEQRKEQIDAVNAALTKQRGILFCSTNFGKTDCAAAIIHEVQRQSSKTPRVLFLVHRIGLANQTAERFKKHLGNSIPIKQLGGGKRKLPKQGVVVATIQTLSNMLYRSDSLSRFLEKCDCVMIDEIHVNKMDTVQRIMDRCEAPMRIGLSGTINKENKLKYFKYLGLTGPIISETRNEELVRLGRSAKPFIRFRKILGPEVLGNYAESYREGIVRHVERNRMVVRETLRYLNRDKRVLITVARKAHGFRLLKLFAQKTDVPCQFIQGSTNLWGRGQATKKFISGKAPILIVSPIGDVGWDLPEIQSWVNAAGGRGWELVLQRLGRTLRKKEGNNRVWITDFLDLHNDYLRKHSKLRLKYYRAENIADIKIVKES